MCDRVGGKSRPRAPPEVPRAPPSPFPPRIESAIETSKDVQLCTVEWRRHRDTRSAVLAWGAVVPALERTGDAGSAASRERGVVAGRSSLLDTGQAAAGVGHAGVLHSHEPAVQRHADGWVALTRPAAHAVDREKAPKRYILQSQKENPKFGISVFSENPNFGIPKSQIWDFRKHK